MTYAVRAIALMTAVFGVLPSPGCRCISPNHTKWRSGYSWQQTDGSIELLNSNGIVWQFNFRKQEGRPYFHPLSLTDGTVLTSLRPPDHPWHRGLWFSWKYINELNYWDPELPPGQTEITNVKTTLGEDYSAHIEISLSYHPPRKPAVLTENRTLVVSAPDENGCYCIDWLSVFTPGEDNVLLDRTPLPGEKNGKPYGGYAGLSLRMAERTKGWEFLSSERPLEPASHGTKARWVDFSGETGNGRFAGVAIFDHPDNPRHPSRWWLSRSMPYFGPAILFDKPYTLTRAERLMLRYRIFVHTGPAGNEMLESKWKSFLTPTCRKQ